MTAQTYAAPVTSAESKPFWDAAKEGRFLVKHCDACGKDHWYPRALCPFCWSDKTSWKDGKGQGEIYSFTVMRKAKVPYALAYVKLDEGPTMMTNVVADDLDTLAIGQRVQVVFGDTADGGKVPLFTPVKGKA